MKFKKVVQMFDKGNVCVTGLRGTGKDMLTANVVARRTSPYVSNVDYGGDFHPFQYKDFEVGGNTYRHFINGELKYYQFPYPDGTDLYLSDVGVYFPSQYCNELNRDYKQFPVYMALSRHLADGNVHFNVQNLNRAWDKIREQSDQYILCRWCFVWHGWVLQQIRIYELYDSCIRRVPPFRLSKPSILAVQARREWQAERDRYEQNFGVVKQKLLFYRNKSTYDTRLFRTLLLKGEKQVEK